MSGTKGYEGHDGEVNRRRLVSCDKETLSKTTACYFSQKDYVCFDFVPQHHNIIRYRKGIAVIKDDFSTVCSWVQFQNKEKWRYDLYLKRNPVPIKCPIAGKFNFTQKGEVLFETR